MDYQLMVREFMQQMQKLKKSRHSKIFNEGLSGEPFILFYIVDHQDVEITPSCIATEMGISTARTAAALNSLEAKGLLTREIDTNDRRRIIVRLTDSGVEYSEALAAKHLQFLTALIEGLGEKDAREYLRITARMAEVYNTLDEDILLPLPPFAGH